MNIRKKTADDVPIHGLHRFTVCDVSSKKALSIQAKLLELARKPFENRKEWEYWSRQLREAFGEYELMQENLIAKVGKSVVAQRLGGTTTYSGTLNYGAVGTSTTSAATTDTQLGAEVYRATVASADVSNIANAIVIISFFYSTTSFTNSNINEFGSFIDGSGSANTGQLFTHMNFSDTINKTALKTLTVDSQYTIS